MKWLSGSTTRQCDRTVAQPHRRLAPPPIPLDTTSVQAAVERADLKAVAERAAAERAQAAAERAEAEVERADLKAVAEQAAAERADAAAERAQAAAERAELRASLEAAAVERAEMKGLREKMAHGPGPPGAVQCPQCFPQQVGFCMALLCGRAARLAARNGVSRPGQSWR